MHTVEVLRDALELAAERGFQLRQEWLGGNGGGACELHGRKILFLDLALSPTEQLDAVLATLRQDAQSTGCPLPTAFEGHLAGA